MTSASYRVQILTQLLEDHGISQIVFSPGSRNAPLVIGFNSTDYFQKKLLLMKDQQGFMHLELHNKLNIQLLFVLLQEAQH